MNIFSPSSCKPYYKWLIYLCLISVSTIIGLLGFGAFTLVESQETQVQNVYFKSLSTQFIYSVFNKMEKNIQSLNTLSHFIDSQCPTEVWPNCSVTSVQSFFDIVGPINQITNSKTYTFTPILDPEQVTEFEAYAYQFYEENGYPDVGISPFGKGIYSIDPVTGERVPNILGPGINNPAFDNKYNIFTPIMQVSNAENLVAVMFNAYSDRERIATIDAMIQCTEQTHYLEIHKCISISPNIKLVSDIYFRPAIIIAHPILGNRTAVVGLTYSVINWDTIFSNNFLSTTNGIDIVLHGGSDIFTWRIQSGIPEFIGVGDHHEQKYNSFVISETIRGFQGPVTYTLQVYPSDQFTRKFHTNNPIYIAISVVVFLLCIKSMILGYCLYVHNTTETNHASQLKLVHMRQLFIQYISHGIRTPLNILLLGTNLFKEELLEADKSLIRPKTIHDNTYKNIRTYINNWFRICEQNELNLSLIHEILDELTMYDKLTSADTLALDKFPFCIKDSIRAVLHNFVQPGHNKCEWVIDSIQNIDMQCFGDKAKIEQSLRILFTNASSRSSSNHTIRIKQIFVEDSSYDLPPEIDQNNISQIGNILIQITDNGQLLSSDDKQEINAEKNINATIINMADIKPSALWIVNKIARLHGGSLLIENNPNDKTTTFTLQLPVYILQSLAITTTPGLYQGIASKTLRSNNAKTVLIIDDSVVFTKLLARLLTNAKYSCYIAHSGKEAIQLYNSLLHIHVRIDIITIDYEMPELNGPDTILELRAAGCTVPIIGITGHIMPEEHLRFIESGAQIVLSKPIRLPELQSCIEKLYQTPKNM